MNTAPFDGWEDAFAQAQEAGAGYFTYGPGGNFGSILLTILGFGLMVAVIVAFMWTENHRLNEQVARLQSSSKTTNTEG